MTPPLQEAEKIRIHVGIRRGYQRIERDPRRGLVCSRQPEGRLRPLPDFHEEVLAASAAFQYISSRLLHDLNSVRMLLDVWDDDLPSVPSRELKERVGAMESWIVQHGGHA
jgi:hypothetical protein